MRHDTDMNRRRLLALCGGLAGGALLPAVASAQQKRAQPVSGTRPVRAPVPAAVAAGRRFFSPAAFALLDEIAEAIIPTDENSGGARAAKVAEFIDTRLGESLDGDVEESVCQKERLQSSRCGIQRSRIRSGIGAISRQTGCLLDRDADGATYGNAASVSHACCGYD